MKDHDATKLLTDMVGIQSHSGEEQELARFLASAMREAGFSEAHVDEAGNAVGHMGNGPRRLVLLGHMDTVPGDVPFTRDGDLLYGRGSVDAKGPLASFVAGVARAGVREGWTVTVVGAVEEEAPTSKGARHVAPLWKPEACIIGEPSGWDAVTLGYKGRLLADYHLEQGTSHSAGPERAVAEFGVDFWNAIVAECDRLNDGHERIFEQLTPALLKIESGNDGLKEWIDLTVSWRTPLWFELPAFEQFLCAASGPADMELYGHEVAYRGGKSNALVRAFLTSIRALDQKPRFKVKTGTADLNILGPVWQCPILAYGPGDSKLDHTPNEHISITEYLKGVDVVSRVVEHVTTTG